MNDPNYRNPMGKWTRDDRFHLDKSGLSIKPREKVVVNVRSRNDPWYGQKATLDELIDGKTAKLTFDSGGTEVVPRRALKRA